MKKYMLIAIAAIAGFTSCKKEASQQTTKPLHYTATAKEKDDDCANPENPYDRAGYQHNIVLQATRSVWSAPNANMSDAYDAIAAYFHDVYGTQIIDKTTFIDIANTVNADESNDFANIISSNTFLSAGGKQWATQLVSIMTDIPDYYTYPDYKAAFVAAEAEIMADNNLTDEDKEALLRTASVARYSMCYWINERVDGNPEGSDPVQCRGIFQRIKEWWNAATDRFDRADGSTLLATHDTLAALGSSIKAFFN